MADPVNAALLTRLPALRLLTAGCLFQAVWNERAGQPPSWGVKDYDVFYFDDGDLSWAAEDAVIRRGRARLGDLGVTVLALADRRMSGTRVGGAMPKAALHLLRLTRAATCVPVMFMDIAPPQDPATERTERHLRMLAELAEIGMGLARAAGLRAAAEAAVPVDHWEPEPSPAGPEPGPNWGIAFARIARTVQQCVAMEGRISAGLAAEAGRGGATGWPPSPPTAAAGWGAYSTTPMTPIPSWTTTRRSRTGSSPPSISGSAMTLESEPREPDEPDPPAAPSRGWMHKRPSLAPWAVR